MSSSAFQYDTQFLTSIERTVTTERLSRYLKSTGQDYAKALLLYEHNIALSEALFGLLHGLEVAVRNSTHQVLTNGFGSPSWYDSVNLPAYWRSEVEKAKDKVVINGVSVPAKVLPHLTFGFWVDLFSKQHHHPLWLRRHLGDAFSYTPLGRDKIHERLKIIQALRNRISHHERVLSSRGTIYNGYVWVTLPEVLQCVEWICPDTAQWMKCQFRYSAASQILKDVRSMGILL
jgi:hypothetical protein